MGWLCVFNEEYYECNTGLKIEPPLALSLWIPKF